MSGVVMSDEDEYSEFIPTAVYHINKEQPLFSRNAPESSDDGEDDDDEDEDDIDDGDDEMQPFVKKHIKKKTPKAAASAELKKAFAGECLHVDGSDRRYTVADVFKRLKIDEAYRVRHTTLGCFVIACMPVSRMACGSELKKVQLGNPSACLMKEFYTKESKHDFIGALAKYLGRNKELPGYVKSTTVAQFMNMSSPVHTLHPSKRVAKHTSIDAIVPHTPQQNVPVAGTEFAIIHTSPTVRRHSPPRAPSEHIPSENGTHVTAPTATPHIPEPQQQQQPPTVPATSTNHVSTLPTMGDDDNYAWDSVSQITENYSDILDDLVFNAAKVTTTTTTTIITATHQSAPEPHTAPIPPVSQPVEPPAPPPPPPAKAQSRPTSPVPVAQPATMSSLSASLADLPVASLKPLSAQCEHPTTIVSEVIQPTTTVPQRGLQDLTSVMMMGMPDQLQPHRDGGPPPPTPISVAIAQLMILREQVNAQIAAPRELMMLRGQIDFQIAVLREQSNR